MSPLYASLVLALSLIAPAACSPAASTVAPSVTLDGATFTGTRSGAISKFLGIPFAQPPVGDLRFRLPVPMNYTEGAYEATAFGPSCPQQSLSPLPLPSDFPAETMAFINNSVLQLVLPDSEDCLSINIVKPASIPNGQKLPVVAFIYGGGFSIGGTSMYDGGIIVQRSIDMGQPIIYVSMNYRLSLFGFLAGGQVRDAGVGNLGLQDQREALRWIQNYIEQFGGDPSKVTLWGQSSGAMSVSLQMVANDGDTEGLFRAGFMQSGAILPVSDIAHGQDDYDALVHSVGCSSKADTLECLRGANYSDLHAAMDNYPNILSYPSLRTPWIPRTDGVLFVDTPQDLLANGSVADIPIVIGNCDDEGTIFSLSNLNITDEQDLFAYIKYIFIPDSMDKIHRVLRYYSNDSAEGSPYDTGDANVLAPQFKRIASIQGDAIFQGPRRNFIEHLSDCACQDVWVYLNKRSKNLPFLGSAHGSDLKDVYGNGEMRDYLINFVNNLDPNGPSMFDWPQWTSNSTTQLTFMDGPTPLVLGQDTYRQDAIDYLIYLTLKYPM